MKLLLSFSLCFIFIIGKSQIQDIESLSEGKYMQFRAIYDTDEKLFGYFISYDLGNTTENKKKYEFVVLDKNLNKVLNNTIEDNAYITRFIPYIDYNKELILSPRVGEGFTQKMVYPKDRKVNLKTNTVEFTENWCYENSTFIECPQDETWKQQRKDRKKEKNEKGYVYESGVIKQKDGTYLVYEYKDYEYYTKDDKVMKYDKNRQKMWEYEYNKNADKKNYNRLNLVSIDSLYLYSIITKIRHKSSNEFNLEIVDMKTGNIVRDSILQINGHTEIPILSNLTGLRSQLGHIDNTQNFEDKVITIGNKYGYYSNTGFIQFIIDKKTLNYDFQKLDFYDHLKQFIPKIGGGGEVENGYYLELRDIYILKDGSVGILMEKYKNGKTTDLVYIITDENFQPKNVQIFEKTKSKNSLTDYLFSQYLNDEKDVVFFYKDYEKDDETKESNWNLYVNSLIDGRFKQEKVPISSKNNFIIPYIAKDGYILLREYNEKDKYNQIRLEKLNY